MVAEKPHVIAQRLVNLYRQAHVINGGFAVINPIFLKEATKDVLEELTELANGKKIIEHISNLKSGKTKMDSIDPELQPYGGLMVDDRVLAKEISVKLSKSEIDSIVKDLMEFNPDVSGLENLEKNSSIKKLGEDWPQQLRAIMDMNEGSYQEVVLEKLKLAEKLHNAVRLWYKAQEYIATPQSDRLRAEVQADLPEFETYLPMFGDAGQDLLVKVRALVTMVGIGPSEDIANTSELGVF